MELASCGPCTLSLDTVRKNVGYLPVVSAAAVADPEMKAIPAPAIRRPTAAPSWLPPGPTTATILGFEMNCWVTVVACAGFSWVSPCTSVILVLLALLSIARASCAKCSWSCPTTASGPVRASSRPIVATHVLLTPPLAVVLLLQPATRSALSAVAAVITFALMDTRLSLLARAHKEAGFPAHAGRLGLRSAGRWRVPAAGARRPHPWCRPGGGCGRFLPGRVLPPGACQCRRRWPAPGRDARGPAGWPRSATKARRGCSAPGPGRTGCRDRGAVRGPAGGWRQQPGSPRSAAARGRAC